MALVLNGSGSITGVTDLATAGVALEDAALTDPVVTGGIYLGGTGAANYLDDYEEGTWTPQVYYQNATDQANATNTTQTGTYTKIGRLVILDFRLIWTAGSAANGNIGVKNLPFTGQATNTYAAAGTVYIVNASSTLNSPILTRPSASGTMSTLLDNNAGNQGNEIGTGSGKEFRGTIIYFTT